MPADAESRGIFQYHRGDKLVYGDPLRIQRDLYAALRDPDAVFAAVEKGDVAAASALNEAARKAFGMVPFDPETGAGATDEDCDGALDALWECLEKKRKKAGDSPTSSEPTTATPAPSPPTSTPSS